LLTVLLDGLLDSGGRAPEEPAPLAAAVYQVHIVFEPLLLVIFIDKWLDE
jgi:hypothetical protein